MFNCNWAGILALWLEKLISTPPVNKSLGLGQIQVLQGPQNTRHSPWEILGRKTPPKDCKVYVRFTLLSLVCKYTEELLPHFTSSISNAALLRRGKMQGALRQTVQGTGLWQGHLCCFEAAVLIYHLHTAWLETKPHISFKKVIRWIRKGQRIIILNFLPFGNYNSVASSPWFPWKTSQGSFPILPGWHTKRYLSLKGLRNCRVLQVL